MISQDKPIIEFRNVSKIYGSLRANNALSFFVRPNTIHAIVGENGAGKSTAMKLLFGIEQPDEGEIFVHGELQNMTSPVQARDLGLGMVQQHFILAQEHTALENVIFSETRKPWSWLHRKNKKQEYQKLAQSVGFKIPWDSKISDLSVGEQQRVEILKVLQQKADILILDEPTAVLTPQEVKDFFIQVRQLRDEGKTIILITHKLKEVLALCDAVTVIRQGQTVGTWPITETSQDHLAEMMVGRKIQWHRRDLHIQRVLQNQPCLEILNSPGLDLKISPGEIVGIAGVEGNGQSEVIQMILNPKFWTSGQKAQIRWHGQDVSSCGSIQIREKSVGVLPEDRLRVGAVKELTAMENFILGYESDPEFCSSMGFMKWNLIHQLAEKSFQQFDVRPVRTDLAFKSFSGGNQQKIVVARELHRRPEFILSAQPTRGVDIGAIEFIHEQLLLAQERGAGILLISSELDELLKLSTRILVLYNHKFVLELQRTEFDEVHLGRAMGGL